MSPFHEDADLSKKKPNTINSDEKYDVHAVCSPLQKYIPIPRLHINTSNETRRTLGVHTNYTDLLPMLRASGFEVLIFPSAGNIFWYPAQFPDTILVT